MTPSRPRYSQLAFPSYSYVPGHAPHPVSDPAGHMFGAKHKTQPPLLPEAWKQSEQYLYGIDLFNHGYYWEAHEAWESLWHAAGRQGSMADFLKALIKLAAAGVKACEGNPTGVTRHATRAQELFVSLTKTNFCGLSVQQAKQLAASLVKTAAKHSGPQPKLLLDAVLLLAK